MRFKDWLKNILEFKYTLIHTALSDEECTLIIGKLVDAGIQYKTKIRGIYASSTRGMGLGRKQSQYDIYVKKEDEKKAYDAIHYK